MWVKIDDGMATHPKLLKAGPLALAIQVRAICYASQNKTDGHIPYEALPILLTGLDQYSIDLAGGEHFATGCQADELDWPQLMAEHGLWDLTDEGITIHDYLEWNVAKKDYEKWRKKLSLSGKKGMKSRWNKEKNNVTKAITTDITNPVTISSTATAISTSSSLNSLHSSDSEFEQFWNSYPKKVGKKAALQAWNKAKDKPHVVDIIQAIENSKNSEQWVKENGQFIPNPSTWLNQGRWADVVTPKKPSLMQEFLSKGAVNGSRTVLQGLADAHYAAVGKTVPGSDGPD